MRNLLTAEDEDDIPRGMRVEGRVIETFRVQNNGVALDESGRREGVGGESGSKEIRLTRVSSGVGGYGPKRGGPRTTLGRRASRIH
jgi:hypothetical protein